MTAHSYDDLQAHLGHNLACVGYGLVHGSADPDSVAIECEDCNTILMEFGQNDEPIDPLETLLADDEVAVTPRRGGGRVVFGIVDNGCYHIRLIDDDGTELARWLSEEWRDDPESVIAAVAGALTMGAVFVKEMLNPEDA